MPRILFDLRSCADPGGIARVTERLLAYVRETRADAEVVTMTTGIRDWRGVLFSRGQNVHREKRHLRNNRFGESRYLFGDIHVGIPNKVWSMLCFLGLTSLDRVAGGGCEELVLPNVGFVGTPKIPYTIVVHDVSFLIEPRWFPWRMRMWHKAVRATRLIQRATQVWCVSHTTARDVVRLLNVPPERITVLPPHIVRGSMDVPSVARTSPAVPYVIAFTGSARKNAATAIAAVERVRGDTRFADLRLLLVGERRAFPNQPWITPVSFLSEDELHDAYRHASALLYPSWYEGFGLPLHEAAMFDIPRLASAHGALPETAPKGTVLIPPAKPHLWASALHLTLERSLNKEKEPFLLPQ